MKNQRYENFRNQLIGFAVIFLALAFCAGLSACSEPLGSDVPAASALNSMVSGALSISPAYATLSAGAKIEMTASGGRAPYRFSILSGEGELLAPAVPSSDHVEFQAGVKEGTVTVAVEDSSGATFQATFAVATHAATPPSPPSPAPIPSASPTATPAPGGGGAKTSVCQLSIGNSFGSAGVTDSAHFGSLGECASFCGSHGPGFCSYHLASKAEGPGLCAFYLGPIGGRSASNPSQNDASGQCR